MLEKVRLGTPLYSPELYPKIWSKNCSILELHTAAQVSDADGVVVVVLDGPVLSWVIIATWHMSKTTTMFPESKSTNVAKSCKIPLLTLLYVYFRARLQQSMQQPGQTNCCFPSKELRLSCGIIPGMFAFSSRKAEESFVTGSLFGPDFKSWVVLSKLSTTRRQVLSKG